MTNAFAVSFSRADVESRARDLFLFVFLIAWLAYTRVYWTLSAAGHTFWPTCPFLLVTGHPCPLCGGTRSFASMWEGDLGRAARFHPLGPLLFAGSLLAALLLLAGLLSGRSWRLWLSRPGRNAVVALIVVAFGISWTLKLFWLGN